MSLALAHIHSINSDTSLTLANRPAFDLVQTILDLYNASQTSLSGTIAHKQLAIGGVSANTIVGASQITYDTGTNILSVGTTTIEAGGNASIGGDLTVGATFIGHNGNIFVGLELNVQGGNALFNVDNNISDAGAGQVATLGTNAPIAGNPTCWATIKNNGSGKKYFLPLWQQP